jgi:FlgD Ig-like domain/FG-GAP-like repeat
MPLDLNRSRRHYVPLAVALVSLSCAIHPAAARESALASAISNVAHPSASLPSTTAGNCWGLFAYPVDSFHAFNPEIADLNEDGINDLVTSGWFGSSATYEPRFSPLYIALGQATAGSWSSFATPAIADPFGFDLLGAKQLADINDDGILDVIGCRLGPTSPQGGIDVYFGMGEDGVGDGQVSSVLKKKALPNLLTGLRMEDFNEDGILDAVAWSRSGYPYPSFFSDSVVILRGLGTQGVGSGLFANPVIYQVGAPIWSLETADLDEDGILDLVVGLYPGGATILKGQGVGGKGNGSFTPAGSYATGVPVRVADLTEDGLLDLVSFVGLNNLQVRPGLGDGTFGDAVVVTLPLTLYINASPEVYVADMNQDGRKDVVRPNGLADIFGSDIHWYSTAVYDRTGGSSLDSTSFVFDSCGTWGRGGAYSAGIMDINGDRAPDYIEVSGFTGANFLVNDRSPSTSPALTLVQPTGGELWPVGSERTISWTRSPGWGDGVSIEVSRDGGANWELIAHDLIRESWVWTVTPPATNSARIRVRHVWTALTSDVSPADFMISLPTGDVGADARAKAIALSPARPNPTTGSSQLTLTLPAAATVNVVVTDAAGRLVRTLAQGSLGPGRHELSWDGTRVDGSRAPAGVYWLEARSGSERATRRIVRLD